MKWASNSWKWYSDLLAEHDPEVTGVTTLSCLLYSQYHQQLVQRRHMHSLSPVYRDLSERELNLALPEGKFKYGKYIQTMQIDMDIYLKYLTEKFKERGKIKEFKSCLVACK